MHLHWHLHRHRPRPQAAGRKSRDRRAPRRQPAGPMQGAASGCGRSRAQSPDSTGDGPLPPACHRLLQLALTPHRPGQPVPGGGTLGRFPAPCWGSLSTKGGTSLFSMKSRAAFTQRPALPSAGGFFLAQQAKRPPRQERCGKPHARGLATPGFEATSRQMINRCERPMWMKRNAAQTGTD